MQVVLKCQIKNRKSGAWPLPTTLQLHWFARILAPCHFNFNSDATGKTSVATKTSKTTTAWWLALALNSRKMQVVLKCQIKNQKSGAWPLPATLQLHWFAHILAPCHSNFKSDATGKTRVATKTSKTTTAWWLALASNSKKKQVALRCQIKNLKSGASQTGHKAGLHSENWWLASTSQRHSFDCTICVLEAFYLD